ncbi:MAG: enoyl-CoA hydratase [Actinomycetota bacterium]|nr:enoyl-CoA hydratase [Actinomycetota bacterium]
MPLPDTAANGLADVAADAAPGAAPAAGDGGVLAGPAQPDGPAGIPTTPGVRVERIGLAAIIVIDRPQAQNAISRPTMAELGAALDEVAASDARVVALRGAGERVFVSGGDLKELASIRTEAEAQAMALTMRTLLDRVASLPAPVVAALNGHAYGGGCEVAMACDLRLAADDVKLAFNQVDLGIMPAWGGIERLQAVVGRGRALYLLTTGLPIDAPTAAAWGLVEQVVPRPEFDDRLTELLDRMARAPRDALVGIKAAADAARPAARPDLAPAATASFAATWVGEAHWTAVAAMEERRRQARAPR